MENRIFNEENLADDIRGLKDFAPIIRFVAGGDAVIEGTGIPCITIWRRIEFGGESFEELSEDYSVTVGQIKNAYEYAKEQRRKHKKI